MFELIGYAAGLCTALSFIPQAWQTFRTKNVQGMSAGMYFIFNTALICWVIYGLHLKSVQMVLFNALCLCFSLPILLMIIKYRHLGNHKIK